MFHLFTVMVYTKVSLAPDERWTFVNVYAGNSFFKMLFHVLTTRFHEPKASIRVEWN